MMFIVYFSCKVVILISGKEQVEIGSSKSRLRGWENSQFLGKDRVFKVLRSGRRRDGLRIMLSDYQS